MLGPSRQWLADHRDKPFFATYLTVAPHHECEPLTRHGFLHLDGDPAVNRYLNNVRSEDFFLRGLIEQYRELGIYERTVFIVLGDHGEGFGEHGRRAHDNVPYEEGLRVPFLIHGGGVKPGVLPGPVSHLDLVPTILDLLGMRISKGKLAGSSIFSRPKEKPVFASCFGERECLVHLHADRKLIHFFGHRGDELYFLEQDPEEKHNLAAEKPELAARKLEELLHWDQRVRAIYWGEGLLLGNRR
jgi:arylsulfatase A-like enzyme